ncbi:MAG TPA: Wzz/FepE/Etk N-terminal domain-containing protein, partial [Solirubrobacterales bacterium]|nr:Wzz/FepE/Etk N-terminal domain-containing protein [Solirubrobacterales bacterium]
MESFDRGSSRPESTWLIPQDEQQGLRRYVETLRERLWLIVGVVIVTTAFAIVYVALATKTYEGEAGLFVNCARSDDPALEGLPVIRCTSDPTRDVS